MGFISMMKQDYGLDDNQANALQTELKELEVFFDNSFEDTPNFFSTFYQRFEKTIAAYGFKEDAEQAELLVSRLYKQGKFRILVSYIIPAFYNSGGDREIFEDTYTQMMNSH